MRRRLEFHTLVQHSISEFHILVQRSPATTLCRATDGAGIYVQRSAQLEDTSIELCSTAGNEHSAGGGVYMVAGSVVTAQRLLLRDNAAASGDELSIQSKAFLDAIMLTIEHTCEEGDKRTIVMVESSAPLPVRGLSASLPGCRDAFAHFPIAGCGYQYDWPRGSTTAQLVGVCSTGAVCTPHLANENISSPSCQCDGPLFQVRPGEDAILAPYVSTPAEGCVQPVHAHSLSHVDVVTMLTTLHKTEDLAVPRNLTLTLTVIGTYWPDDHLYAWRAEASPLASLPGAVSPAGLTIITPSGLIPRPATNDTATSTVEIQVVASPLGLAERLNSEAPYTYRVVVSLAVPVPQTASIDVQLLVSAAPVARHAIVAHGELQPVRATQVQQPTYFHLAVYDVERLPLVRPRSLNHACRVVEPKAGRPNPCFGAVAQVHSVLSQLSAWICAGLVPCEETDATSRGSATLAYLGSSNYSVSAVVASPGVYLVQLALRTTSGASETLSPSVNLTVGCAKGEYSSDDKACLACPDHAGTPAAFEPAVTEAVRIVNTRGCPHWSAFLFPPRRRRMRTGHVAAAHLAIPQLLATHSIDGAAY